MACCDCGELPPVHVHSGANDREAFESQLHTSPSTAAPWYMVHCHSLRTAEQLARRTNQDGSPVEERETLDTTGKRRASPVFLRHLGCNGSQGAVCAQLSLRQAEELRGVAGVLRVDPLNHAADAQLVAPTSVETVLQARPHSASHVKARSKAVSQLIDWGLKRIGGQQSSTVSGDGKGVVTTTQVFVLDTGITHPDVNVVEHRSFLGPGTTAKDENGHGTHVAGIIGALDNGSYTVGAAPGVALRNYRVLDAKGGGGIPNILRAVDAVVQWKITHPGIPCVINLSLGMNSPGWTALDAALQTAVVKHGIVACVAAGNEGKNAQSSSPAHVPEVLTVGAFGANNTLADFSNWGQVVDVLAPGVDIVSLSPLTKTKMTLLSGTSMACPYVTGAVALYLSRHPTATPAQVKQVLVASAQAATAAGSNAPAVDRLDRPSTTRMCLWLASF